MVESNRQVTSSLPNFYTYLFFNISIMPEMGLMYSGYGGSPRNVQR